MIKIEIKNLHINVFRLLRYSYPVTITLILIALSVVFFFLYQKVYKTLAFAEIVTNLKQKVPEEELEKNKFQSILDKIHQKVESNAIDFNNLKNPFAPL